MQPDMPQADTPCNKKADTTQGRSTDMLSPFEHTVYQLFIEYGDVEAVSMFLYGHVGIDGEFSPELAQAFRKLQNLGLIRQTEVESDASRQS